MITEKLDISPENYGDSIEKAVAILKSGGIVAIPTETVYGLAASSLDKEAIEKVFNAKGRPQDNPLIVHISNIDMLYKVAKDIPESAIECAKRFWPGPFTMVLPRTDKTAPAVSAGLPVFNVSVSVGSIASAYDVNRMTDQMMSDISEGLAQLQSRTKVRCPTSTRSHLT